MKFDHGTTTLGFLYQGGVVLAVDSRATGGSYIGIHFLRSNILPIKKGKTFINELVKEVSGRTRHWYMLKTCLTDVLVNWEKHAHEQNI